MNKTLITRRSLVRESRKGLLALAVLACLGQMATAQTTTTGPFGGSTPLGIARGTPAGAYALSGFESVNLYNGNLNFRLPLLQVGGRGGAQTSMMAALNLKGWHVKHSTFTAPNGDVTESFAPDQSWWGLSVGYGPGVMQGRHSGVFITTSCLTHPKLYTNTITRLTFTAADGTEYELRDQISNGQPKPLTSCSPTGFNRGTIFVTADGTAATFFSDTAIVDNAVPQGLGGLIFPSGNFLLRDGTRYRIVNGLVTSIRDRNGNLVTFEYDANSRVISIVDSINRQVTINYCVSEPGYGFVDQIIYKGFGGGQRMIRVAKYDHLSNDNLGGNRFRPGAGYSVTTYGQLFPELNGSQSTVNDPSVLGAVYLPDGRSYQFYYNPYGELERIVLPTGGAVEYRMVPGSGVYPTFPDAGDYQINRRVAERLVFKTAAIGTTPEQRTIYTPTYSLPSEPRPWSTTVFEDQVDPSAGNVLLARTKHNFEGSALASMIAASGYAPNLYPAWDEGKEKQTDGLDFNGTTILRRVNSSFAQRTNVAWWPGWATQMHLDQAAEPAMDPRLTETRTKLMLTNLVSKQIYSYDQYNNRTDVFEYDLGAGSPGALKRHTVTGYVTSSAYATRDGFSAHLLSLALQESIRDGNDIERARTSFEYDTYSTGLVDRPGISGHKASYDTTFVTRGNVTKVTKWLLPSTPMSTSMSYDIAGNVVSSTDPRNNTTTSDFSDQFGIPDNEARSNTPPLELAGELTYAFATRVTNALAHESYTQFDYYTGKPVNGEDANGIVAKGSYNDLLDRPTQLVEAVGTSLQRQATFVYNDPVRTITTMSDLTTLGDNALKSEIVYDGLGRTIEARTYEPGASIIRTITGFDSMGRQKSVSNPHRTTSDSTYGVTVTSYDALSRIKRVETFDGFNTSTGAVTTDYMDNRTTVTDQAGKQRRSFTDGLGRVTQVVEDPNSLTYSTTYVYDALDDLASVTQGSQLRFFMYDSLKRLTRARNPEQGTNSSLVLTDPVTGNSQWSVGYVYDANSNLTQKTDPRNIATNYVYDVLNRVTTRSYANDPAATPAVTYAYDSVSVTNSKGRLTSVNSLVSSHSYSAYDVLGRSTAFSQTTSGNIYPMSSSYNLAGRMTSETYPSGRQITTGYDSAGRISTIQGQKAGEPNRTYGSQFSYASQGAVMSVQLGNTKWEHTNFNSRLQPLQIGLGVSATNSSILQLDYGYGTANNNGNVLSQRIVVVGSPGLDVTQTYGFDQLNRLSSASEGGSWSQTNDMDRHGNRAIRIGSYIPTPALTPQSVNSTDFSAFNQNTNRIALAGFGYDTAGNLTGDPTTPANAMIYDAENKQISYTQAGVTTTYAYDGDGRRVKKLDSTGTIIFVYNAGGQLIAEYHSDPVPPPAGGGGTSYLTSDHLGSTRVVTKADGTVKARYDYLPFGEELGSGIGQRTTGMGYNLADSTKQKFTQKERDSESGLDYFEARYYSSAMGRFTSADSTGGGTTDPQTLNRYTYTINNPLKYVDPTGHFIQFSAAERGANTGSGLDIWEATREAEENAPTHLLGNDQQQQQQQAQPAEVNTYLILVGEQGLGGHDQGTNFLRAAETRKAELESWGNQATIVPVGSVTEVRDALLNNEQITGGVIFYGHGGLIPNTDRIALHIGQGSGLDSNLDRNNVWRLDGRNLGPKAVIELNACHSGLALPGRPALAQAIANQLQRWTTGYDTGIKFTGRPGVYGRAKYPPSKGPVYMVPAPPGRLMGFSPHYR